jgi:hypothetical protein
MEDELAALQEAEALEEQVESEAESEDAPDDEGAGVRGTQ